MADERPQFYENHLTPLTINTHSLTESLQELRVAVHNGAESMHKSDPIPGKWNVGGMFKHFPGTETIPRSRDLAFPICCPGQCGANI